MRIAYAVDQYWPAISGVPVSVDAFKDEMVLAGHTVHVFAPSYPGAADGDRQTPNSSVHRFPSYCVPCSRSDRLVFPHEKARICRVLDAMHPDVIHVHTEFMLGKTCLAYARRRDIPVVCTAHTNWEQLAHLYLPLLPPALMRLYARRRFSRTYNQSDAVIVPTVLMRDRLLANGVCAPLEVIPTGIVPDDLDGIDRCLEKRTSELFRRFPSLVGKRLLLAAGRVGWEKNLSFLVDVLGRLVPDFPDVMLMVVGDGPYRNQLRRYVAKQGLAAYVVFTGSVRKQDMKRVYGIADVLVFASKVETQGLVIIEAMYCGVPVVAIGEMGTREVMNGDNGGFMVEDDIDVFTEKTRLILRSPDLWERKSREGRRHAEAWTISSCAARLLALYQLALEKNPSRCAWPPTLPSAAGPTVCARTPDFAMAGRRLLGKS